jgi:hypothetical protein
MLLTFRAILDLSASKPMSIRACTESGSPAIILSDGSQTNARAIPPRLPTARGLLCSLLYHYVFGFFV